MLKLKRSIYAVSAALALYGASCVGLSAEARADPTTLQLVEKAQSPADHVALAKRYEQQAVDYERQAAEHEKLAAKYRKADLWNPDSAALTIHCENLAKRMTEAATEAREIAQLHADIAKLITAGTR